MIWLLTIFVKSVCWVVARVPRRLQTLAGSTLGLVWYYVVPIRRSVALENVRRAFPAWTEKEVRRNVRRNFQNYGCGLIEFFLLPALSDELLKKIFVVEGIENYQKAKAQGRGVFLLTLHIGSWELMSATALFLGIPLHVITKRFKAKGLNQVWVNLRLGRGLKLISEEKSTFQILRAIRQGEVVGFILDQFMGPPVGAKIKFFGIETGAPAALALFTDRTRAPVVPVYNIRQPDGRVKIIFESEIPFMEQGGTAPNISFMTQVYTSKIEEIVRKYPEQWLWIHRRWKPFRE